MRRKNILWIAVAISNSFAQSPPPPDPAEMRVRLLAPLNTKLNRKGDIVSASVLEPAKYRGAILEGDIGEVRPGGSSSNKHSYIQFQFHTLHASGAALPVAINLVEIINSKKQPDIDEDGSMLESEGRTGLASFRTTAGGRIHRGTRDFGPVSEAPCRLSVKAANLSFAPGSELSLRFKLKSR
jgi:hypothetical protein